MSNPFPLLENRPLDQLKVAELRDELRKRGLSLKGVKKDLFERLDEVVRKEQAGSVGDGAVKGGELPHYYNSVETSQDDDGRPYLNDSENIQDALLIVNNASPYVGASDATPVLMDHGERLPAIEEKEEDVLEPSNTTYSEKSAPEDGNEAAENVAHPGKHKNETSIFDSSSNQVSAANASLLEIGSQDTVLPCPLGERGISNIAQETKETLANDSAVFTSIGDGIVASESAFSAQEFSGVEVNDVILPEGDKDVPSESVSDDILIAADVSVTAVDTVVIANDSPMKDVEVFARNVLTSVSVVPCLQELGKEPEGGAVSIGISEKAKEELMEEASMKGGSQEGDEALEAKGAAPQLPMLEAGQELQLPAFEEPKDNAMQFDSVVQEEPQDIEMSEAYEKLSAKLEVNPPGAVPEASDLPTVTASETLGNVGITETGSHKEAERAVIVEEMKLHVKPESREVKSRMSRRAEPLENADVEQQGIKEDLLREGRSFERSRPRGYESDRFRHNSTRAFDERGRLEGVSGRHFKEEGRNDPKETVSKLDGGQKRKDDDMDPKQQEPPKRVRRWNSGNQPPMEATRPLTSRTFNEVSLEVNGEEISVGPPKVTPKLPGPAKSAPLATKSGSEANGEKRAVPPSTCLPSASLKVERFVRPFTLNAVKDLLAEYGECVDFWMDQIKTHCYVTYSNVEEAVAARNGLYDRQWPPAFGNLLVADFVDTNEVKIRSDGTFEKMNVPAVATPRGFLNNSSGLGAQHGYANAVASAAPLRERQFMQPFVKDLQPPVPTLDDLFRKTMAKPHIYYLPLTDAQVAVKLAAAKNKDLQPVRSRPMGRV